MARPLVSVVIPCYNRRDLTQRCLDHLAAARTEVDLEVVAVDNGSSDGTRELLASRAGPRFRAILNTVNRNFAGASNQGIRSAKGRFALLLNNDTEPTDWFLDPLVEVLEREPDVAVAGSKLLYPDGTVQHAGVVLWQHNHGELLFFGHPYSGWDAAADCVNRRRDLQVVTAASALVRVDAVREVGGFDERYRNSCEDIDLCLRLRRAGWRVVYEPRSVVVHLDGQSPGRRDHDAANLQLLYDTWASSVVSDEEAFFGADGLPELAVLAAAVRTGRRVASRYLPLVEVFPAGSRDGFRPVDDSSRDVVVDGFHALNHAYEAAKRGGLR